MGTISILDQSNVLTMNLEINSEESKDLLTPCFLSDHTLGQFKFLLEPEIIDLHARDRRSDEHIV